jgi:hypothetical protein
MDQQLLQRTRYLLQIRFRRMMTATTGNYELICSQVLTWLETHPIIGAVVQHLDKVEGQHHEEINLLLKSDNLHSNRYYAFVAGQDKPREDEPQLKGYTCKTIDEHASACLQILRGSIERPNVEFYCLFAIYLTHESYGRHNMSEVVDVLQNRAIHDLYEYLDEALDSINAVNGLLLKYKQNAEWFERENLQLIIQNGYSGKKGERALAIHLQQYVFNQGVDFVIEASSPSGEADLLLRDSSGGYAIVDAKLIDGTSPSEVKRTIAEGFNQVARYCNDYNQPEGFLTVFVNVDVNIRLDTEYDSGFKYFKVGGCIIYYLEINISERPSASKAKKSKEIDISAKELIEKIEEIQRE